MTTSIIAQLYRVASPSSDFLPARQSFAACKLQLRDITLTVCFCFDLIDSPPESLVGKRKAPLHAAACRQTQTQYIVGLNG
ncbi:hypothetical protein WJX77_008516 [Trebouxia sp. C0004]